MGSFATCLPFQNCITSPEAVAALLRFSQPGLTGSLWLFNGGMYLLFI